MTERPRRATRPAPSRALTAPAAARAGRPGGRHGARRRPARARVAAARAAWTRHLVDLGGRNTLLWYRDLPTGTLDLTTAHPGGVAMLLAGRPTRLSDLVREPAALEDARRRARAIAAKSRELAEERGILTGFLAIGMATWAVRLPDGRTGAARPGGPGAAALVHTALHRRRPGRLRARPRARRSSSTRCSCTTCPPSRASPSTRRPWRRSPRPARRSTPTRSTRRWPGPAPPCPTSR